VPVRRLGQCADDGAARETDLERVMLEAFRIVQQEIRRAGERRLDGELTAQRRFD